MSGGLGPDMNYSEEKLRVLEANSRAMLEKLQRLQQQQPRPTKSHSMPLTSSHLVTSHKPPSSEDLLAELRRHELRNSSAIHQLKDELRQLRSQPATSQLHYSSYDPAAVHPGAAAVHPGIPQQSAVLLPYQHDYVASEANLLKMRYLAGGGNDPNVIRQLNDLVAQAVSLHPLEPRPRQEPPSPDPMALKIVEEYKRENEKLKEELELLKSNKSQEMDELRQLKRAHMIKMTSMQQELEELQQAAQIEAMRNKLKPKQQETGPFQPVFNPESSQLMAHSRHPMLDSLVIGPYDPASGFMIFYDYILHVDPAYRSLKVQVSLLRGAVELGSAVQLPWRDCVGMHGETYDSSLLHCIIGNKQPVTKCLPSPDLTLLAEVKGSATHESNPRTVSWAKFLLFDEQHRVLSGRWKVPLRVGPVRVDLHPKETNGVPQHGKMELYYRICNGRDAEVQTRYRASPAAAYQYIYPPTSFDDPIYVQPEIRQHVDVKPAAQRLTSSSIVYTPIQS